ncbi:hypothetical protein AYI68_g847 [Smittium mucronatum]|uniref:Uncharacterized protein n=1 Tax=Smittium mucronatum TaxID=133383 RepID=A0A1R0H752_9FUNG|nr:hypothetical protein AYI68_g847 [Smittium mucronatum]
MVYFHTILINNSLGYDYKLSIYESESPVRQGKGPQNGSQQTDQRGQDGIERFSELHWESSKNVSSPPLWTPNAERSIGAKKYITLEGFMDLESKNNQASGSETILVEGPANGVERSFVHPGDPRAGNLYRFQLH